MRLWMNDEMTKVSNLMSLWYEWKTIYLGYCRKKNRLVSGMAYFFWNNSRNIGTVISRFVTLPLEIHKTKPGNPQNCVKPYSEIPDDIFLIIPRDSTTFLINPWKFCLLFLQYPWKFHIFNPLNLNFLFWNSPLALAISWQTHCVRSVQIRSFSGPYFLAFRLNTEFYGVNLRIQFKCWKILTTKKSVFGHFSHSDLIIILQLHTDHIKSFITFCIIWDYFSLFHFSTSDVIVY